MPAIVSDERLAEAIGNYQGYADGASPELRENLQNVVDMLRELQVYREGTSYPGVRDRMEGGEGAYSPSLAELEWPTWETVGKCKDAGGADSTLTPEGHF